MNKRRQPVHVAIIGCVGIPNRYGGFESYAEHISPALQARGLAVTVTCERARYSDDLSSTYKGVSRRFIPVPANGGLSPLHDLLAFLSVVGSADVVLVLGVSGGLFFPLFRLLANMTGCQLLVNIDGVEWRRTKFGFLKRQSLVLFDWWAQRFSHRVIYDNKALASFLRFPVKSHCIAYSGDHAIAHMASPMAGQSMDAGLTPYVLTVCRIEPENNCELLIQGFLASSLSEYRFIGNWDASAYGRELRQRYAGEPRLRLLNPIYDAAAVYELRRGCGHYLHGHGVGGTNPSLVEMLFFDCNILCFDCPFNRCTAEDAAGYFQTTDDMAKALNSSNPVGLAQRKHLRQRYTVESIVDRTIEVMGYASQATTPPVGHG